MKAPGGYSGRPLALKLGLKEGCRFSSIRAPKHYPALLGRLPAGVDVLGGRSAGLVDVKVAAIDEDWSGLKFVYRLKDRPAR